MSKRYYWLKLKENFFDDPRIKKMRRMESGDTMTIIYQKMLLQSINTEGKMYFENIEDTFVEEVALRIDESVEIVQRTVDYLISKGMLEDSNDEYFLPETVAMVGSETDKAELMRKKRERDRQRELGNNVTQLLPNVTQRKRKI